MNGFHVRRFAATLVLAVLGGGAIRAADDPAETAQHLIFDAPHFASVKEQGDIYYSYLVNIANKEMFGEGFKDTVRLNLKDEDPATPEKDATLFVYTGERERDPMTFKKRTSNPVILMFLEQDLWRMRQRIGGRADYFKARVADAIRKGGRAERVTVKVGSRDLAATRLTFKPFEADPNADRLQFFRTKTYEFTLSDEVPGKVVELRTTVYDPATADGKPVLEEKLSYDRAATGS